jgi:uncharacterized protein YndB with AHSA1/START domain
MSTWSYRVTAHSAASPQRVYDLLADAPGWTRWAPGITRASWESEGDPPPGGTGAVRAMGRRGLVFREQVLAAEPGRLHSYTVLGGPAKAYRADVRLDDAPTGGTAIEWVGTFTPRVPGTGRLLVRITRSIIQRFANALAREAERPPR